VHEDEIRVSLWRIRLVAAVGVALLAFTIAVLVFPIALVVFAFFALLDAPWGLDLGLVVWSAAMSAGIGAVSAAGVFGWALARAERRALEMVRAWPYPGSPPAPPPRMPDGAYRRAERLIQGLALAAGVLPPSCAVVVDDAPNCLAVGRNPTTAWIVVTTGLLDLPRPELEAVLAYEIGRVAELEVSYDTVVYACSARSLELWAAAFGEFDEVSVLLAPFAVLLTPVVAGGMLLRAAALRTRARLSDGLAVRYSRNPVALAHALRRILEDPAEVRRGDPGNAHLWLEYPHTRASRWFLRSHRILPRRVERLERMARLG
jgi:Zn-dependent protease with chaperone function